MTWTYERWTIVDTRTRQPCTVTTFPTRETAESQLASWRARDAKGGRPDVHEAIPHLAVARLSEATA